MIHRVSPYYWCEECQYTHELDKHLNSRIKHNQTTCCWCDKESLPCSVGFRDEKCFNNACKEHQENHDLLCDMTTKRLINKIKPYFTDKQIQEFLQ